MRGDLFCYRMEALALFDTTFLKIALLPTKNAHIYTNGSKYPPRELIHTGVKFNVI